jgi:RNA-directed DNA polymerase
MKVTESGAGKHRQLQIEDYLQRVSAEQKEYAGVCGPPKMAETDITDTTEQTEGLLGQILATDNLNRAYKQVKRNKGAGGIDGMQVDELLPCICQSKTPPYFNRKLPHYKLKKRAHSCSSNHFFVSFKR